MNLIIYAALFFLFFFSTGQPSTVDPALFSIGESGTDGKSRSVAYEASLF